MAAEPDAVVESGAAPLGVSARPPRSLARAFWPIAVTGAVLALVPLWLGDSRYLMRLAVDALVFGAYAIAFNVIFGSTNQLFLCVGALAGVGGYTSAILADRAKVPMVVAMLLAAALAAALGGFLSWVAVRRSLDVIFTGIVTLALSLSFASLLLGQRDLTGGETGLLVSAGADTFLQDRVAAYYLFLGMLVAFLVVFRALQRSHIGWAFRALRDNQLAAELAGVAVARYRAYAGVIGSAMLGLTGAVFAHSDGFISPSTFDFGNVDVRVLVMLAFGGLGTLLGPVLGTVVFAVLDEVLIDFGQLRTVVYGLLVIALFLGFKRGAVPAVADFVRMLARRARSRVRRPP
ncbi:MAG TPA: branched-chain amino acid ABC transporter permease [Actinomycetes bacterium]|nr:branched-chain amino acid ABC transporter permease [Actinomycetes bacterium]